MVSEVEPVVTICVPTYNVSSTLLETMESVRAQTHQNLKIKIFDNQSDDNTLDLVEAIAVKDSRVTVTRNEKNLGGEGNFTRCIQAAEGAYTALFHSDDVYDEDIIARAIQELDGYPGAVAVFFHADLIDGQGKGLGERFVPDELRKSEVTSLNFGQFFDLVMKYGNFVTCPSVVARSAVYSDRISEWRGGAFATSADLDVWLRMAQQGEVLFVNRSYMKYRVSEASYSFRLSQRRVHRHDLFLVLDEYLAKAPGLEGRDYQKYYDFLEYKDVAFRSYNMMRNLSTEAYPVFTGRLGNVFKVAKHSSFHHRFFAKSLAIFFCRLLFTVRVRTLLSKFRFA